MGQSAVEVFEQIKRSYPTASPGGRTMHEAFSLLESEVRFVALLAAATARSADRRSIGVGRSPGLGAWIAFLRSVEPKLDKVGTEPALLVRTMVGEVLEEYDRGILAAPQKLRSVKALRDHVMHGGALPDGDTRTIYHQVDQLVERISDAIVTGLADATVTFRATDSRDEQRLGFVWRTDEISLWPYMYAHRTASDAEPQLHLFASFMKATPTYLCFGDDDDVLRHPSGEILLTALGAAVKSPPVDRQFAAFVNAVQLDIQGFIETDAEPIWVEEDDGFEYRWEKATGQGTEHRWDQFRLGPADARQWRSEDGKWVEYPRFLRALAHWRTVATRLRQGLVAIEKTLDWEEREALGWEPARVEIRPAQLEISDLGGAYLGRKEFSSLFESVDEDLQVNRGETQVIFINGEAGIGKTRAMVHAAKKRAQAVEAGADLPLFLYVRSTGHVLESLDTVVAATVASTRNLTEEAVRALCRNGLMTLFIDGFDELLGGVGFRDAIASLRPWLIALGGRGVLVVSARSSYYLGQYRSSLNRAQADQDLRVRHRIADVKRWDSKQVEDFLEEFSVPPELVRAQLSPPDWKLLGLPFFARAFAEMYRRDPGVIRSGSSLRNLLLGQYLERESAKLNSGRENSGPLLTPDEMRQLFEMLAEEMASKEQREAGAEELEFLAAVVTNDEDLASHPRLKERLTVLCGLAVDTGEAGTGRRRFRFQHELFFDQFLAGAAARRLSRGQIDQFFNMLHASQWRAATVMGVVTEAGAESIADVLADYPSDLIAQIPATSETAATNLGSLWAAIIQITGRAHHDISSANFTEGIDLSDVHDVNLFLKDCEVSSLALPLSGKWTVALTGSAITELMARAPNLDLKGLTGVQHRRLMRMITAKQYSEKQPEIFRELIRAGAQVADPIPVGETSGQSMHAQAAERFLTRMESRGSTYVVLRADNLQPHKDDGSSAQWTQEYGAETWSHFTHGLLNVGLASAQPFPASGVPKKRFKLEVSISVLLGRGPAPESTKVAIDKFWAGMRSK